MIRVGFDISQVAHQGGVSTYTQNLAQQLITQRELEMVFFYSSLRKPFKGRLPHVKSFRLPPTLFEVLFNKMRNTPIERFIGQIDVFHSSDWIQPPTKAKKVTTYHDLVPILYPQWSVPKIINVQKRRLQLVENEVDMVIAVSQATKNDLLKASKIPEKKIVVIYEAAAKQFRVQDEKQIESFRKKYNLPKEFVLAIGGVGERRNLKRVKEACKGFNLVIVGETVSNLSQDEIPLLYAASDVLFYPSFYEGFGLPVLESMACGTPVITSQASSLPEVGGEAAMYVDPNNLEQMKKTLKRVLKDKDLQKNMVNKGFNQVKKFSWEKTAAETAKVYSLLVKNET